VRSSQVVYCNYFAAARRYIQERDFTHGNETYPDQVTPTHHRRHQQRCGSEVNQRKRALCHSEKRETLANVEAVPAVVRAVVGHAVANEQHV
jgi:hypothetical protein